jgi:hypothetical protein
MVKSKAALVSIVVLLIAAIAIFNYFSSDKDNKQTPPTEALSVNGTTNAFTESITNNLKVYDSLRTALVNADTASARLYSVQLTQQLQAIPFNDMQADTTLRGLAQGITSNIITEATQVNTATDIEAQRKAFQPLSDLLFDLLRTVQYSGAVVFQQHCPMAFDNTGANWLSFSREIVNPYFGDKMLHCGNVQDSVSFGR